MHVIGVRRSGRRHRYADEMHTPDRLLALVPRADFVLMSAPHTDESHHMIGAEELARMKKGAGLVNYSRANCVDYDALIDKLERGEMSAVLDVFDPEPLPRALAAVEGAERDPHPALLLRRYRLLHAPHPGPGAREHRAPPRGQAAQETGVRPELQY